MTSREPAPTSRYTRISIGDVGFIRRGQFHLLFSAGSPLGERERGVDVPTTFQPLDVEIPESIQPRQPGCLRTNTVQEVVVDGGATVSATLYVQLHASSFTTFKRIQFRPLEPGASFSYELTENHGAALVTKYETYRMDALVESEFRSYTKRYYESWVTFARDKRFGDDIQPVLVSGFDMTKDFAMIAYSDDRDSSRANFANFVPTPAFTSAPLWGTWRTTYSPYTNCGPYGRGQAVGFPSQQSVEAGTIPNGFDQCVFVRYFTMRPKKHFWSIPTVIRAGAGPHDLGSGENEGDAFPELTVQFDHELTASDGDFDGEWGPNSDDSNSEPDVVVHNNRYVLFLPCSLRYVLTFATRMTNMTPGMPLRTTFFRSSPPLHCRWVTQPFQWKNSSSVSALMHHCDIMGIRMVSQAITNDLALITDQAGGADDLPTLLAMHKPRIVVDESGG